MKVTARSSGGNDDRVVAVSHRTCSWSRTETLANSDVKTNSSADADVIRGDFTGRIQAVRAASDAAAVKLPLYGRIAAGLPIEALHDNAVMIDVPASLLGSGDHTRWRCRGIPWWTPGSSTAIRC